MRRNLFFLAICLSFFTIARATTDTVTVANFQFTPATVNAVVGDTILWIWENGEHTTTSTDIPAGAETWSSPMDAANPSFTYVITIAGTYDYWCIPHSPDMAGTIIASEAMPVRLADFNITSTDNNKALLTWKTLTELNTEYFSIQRSTDGGKFTEIGRVDAVGNSVTTQKYSFTDNTPGDAYKYIYYMLEIVDKDGARALSDIKMFRNNAAKAKLIASLSPNPVSSPGHLMLQFNADKAGSMEVKLYDASGKLVKQTEMTAVAGLNNGHFHLGNLPAGFYTIVFSLDGMKESRRIIMQ